MKIAIGADHTAVELKSIIKNYLSSLGHTVEDVGPYSEERTDYPLYAKEVATRVQNNSVEKGILICGTGIGMSIAANKFDGIRAAAVSEPFSAKATREHNDANIICFGSRVVGSELAKMIVDEFLNTEYEGGRHQNRLDQITSYEK
jgi:ribose 5-phosphate isomerase B